MSSAPPRIKWKPRLRTEHIIVHDSHTQADVEDVVGLLRHQGLKSGLLDIGYHVVIERDGRVVECRKRDLIGSHTPGHNLYSIGICMIGGRGPAGEPEDNFGFDQRFALVSLLADLLHAYPQAEIVGHAEIQHILTSPHSCPALDMEQLRLDLKMFQATGVIP